MCIFSYIFSLFFISAEMSMCSIPNSPHILNISSSKISNKTPVIVKAIGLRFNSFLGNEVHSNYLFRRSIQQCNSDHVFGLLEIFTSSLFFHDLYGPVLYDFYNSCRLLINQTQYMEMYVAISI